MYRHRRRGVENGVLAASGATFAPMLQGKPGHNLEGMTVHCQSSCINHDIILWILLVVVVFFRVFSCRYRLYFSFTIGTGWGLVVSFRFSQCLFLFLFPPGCRRSALLQSWSEFLGGQFDDFWALGYGYEAWTSLLFGSRFLGALGDIYLNAAQVLIRCHDCEHDVCLYVL